MVMGELAEGTQVAIIGGGPAGYVCALRLAQLGKQVTVIEKEGLGGLCLLHGCIPSKALIRVADLASDIRESNELGLNAQINSLDFQKAQEWKNKVVSQLNNGTKSLCKIAGVQVIYGKAFFESAQQLLIVTETGASALNFEQVVIATGSLPFSTSDLPIDRQKIITSREALDLTSIPKSMAVIGGGYVGVELAEVYAKLGCKVSMVVRGTLLSSIDLDAANAVEKRLKELGIEIYSHTTTNGYSVNASNNVLLNIISDGKSGTIEVEKVLVSIGHKPFTSELHLDKAGVLLDEEGFVKINSKLQTNVPNIYAIGDVCSKPMLAHKAYRQAKVAAEVIAGRDVVYDNLTVPAVMFSEPEVAYVGMQESEAKKLGKQVIVGKFPHSALGKGIIAGNPVGFVKLIADPDSHALLGALIVGPEASSCITEPTLAIEAGLLLEDIAHTIHTHPTMGEAIGEAAEVALGQAVHMPMKKKTV